MFLSSLSLLQIGEKFYPYCQDMQNMTFKELQAFLRDEQKDPMVEDAAHVNSLFRNFAMAPNRFRDPRQPSLPSLTLSEVRKLCIALPCH